MHSFLEGPSVDREGNLYLVDIPYGRILRVARDGTFSLAAEYDGWPNGLKIHKDGRIFIADHKIGIMVLDPVSGRVEPYLTQIRREGLKGVNDLVFRSEEHTSELKSLMRTSSAVFCLQKKISPLL